MLAEAVRVLRIWLDRAPDRGAAGALHARKLRQRGFNQSELIAREAFRHRARRSGSFCFLESSSADAKPNPKTGLTRHQRRENIRGSFAVVRPEEIAGRDVLLVDDVFTTGTTVSECARVDI